MSLKPLLEEQGFDWDTSEWRCFKTPKPCTLSSIEQCAEYCEWDSWESLSFLERIEKALGILEYSQNFRRERGSMQNESDDLQVFNSCSFEETKVINKVSLGLLQIVEEIKSENELSYGVSAISTRVDYSSCRKFDVKLDGEAFAAFLLDLSAVLTLLDEEEVEEDDENFYLCLTVNLTRVGWSYCLPELKIIP